MKVYDVALVFIRALAALDIIRDVSSILIEAARNGALYAFDPLTRQVGILFERFGFSSLDAVLGIVVSLLIIAVSPRIAAFAAKFAERSDTAAEFH